MSACYDDPYERAHALGPIFRRVWWHSVAGAAVIGLIALLAGLRVPGLDPDALTAGSSFSPRRSA